ncbi:TetR/AcrR family transcriptional regulator [Propionicicella superfundia]|uniref:TetR/AcrR family transcriptional regulator n=1 Tax=Propionicicella superfundia TaxID=348582 RepID=UPI0003FFD79D|nr:TetR/AcrR family transcriptional regulator [Propionicicella superfundia]
MPKIDAPTVAEHRAARREALLEATRRLLAEPGRSEPPSIGEVAERVGMSRPAVYSYFASRDDLIVAAVHDAFPGWVAYVDEAMNAVDDPADRVLEYVDANLRLIARGDHAIVLGLVGAEGRRHSGRMAHESIRIPLTRALTDLGVEKPARMAELIQSLAFTGARMLDAGAPAPEVRRLVRELLEPYVRHVGDDRPPSEPAT